MSTDLVVVIDSVSDSDFAADSDVIAADSDFIAADSDFVAVDDFDSVAVSDSISDSELGSDSGPDANCDLISDSDLVDDSDLVAAGSDSVADTDIVFNSGTVSDSDLVIDSGLLIIDSDSIADSGLGSDSRLLIDSDWAADASLVYDSDISTVATSSLSANGDSTTCLACLACTNLLISLNVAIMGTESSGDLADTQPEKTISHAWLSWPSLAAFMYLKNRRISGFSEDGLRNSFNSLKQKPIILLYYTYIYSG